MGDKTLAKPTTDFMFNMDIEHLGKPVYHTPGNHEVEGFQAAWMIEGKVFNQEGNPWTEEKAKLLYDWDSLFHYSHTGDVGFIEWQAMKPDMTQWKDNHVPSKDEMKEERDGGKGNKDHGAAARKAQMEKANAALHNTDLPPEHEADSGNEPEDEEEDEQVALTFADFLETVIRLRATNQPSVLDIVDMRKLLLRTQRSVMRRLDGVEDLNKRLSADIKMINKTINQSF